VLGKLIRGANRLRKSFQDLDPSEEHFIGRSVAARSWRCRSTARRRRGS
jgi:hypothetical protein